METSEDASANKQFFETHMERLLHNLQSILGVIFAFAAVVSLSGFVVVNSSLLKYSNFTVYTLVPGIYLSAGILFSILLLALSLWTLSLFNAVKVIIFRLDPSDKNDGHVFLLLAGFLILLSVVLSALSIRTWPTVGLMMTILLVEFMYFDQLNDRIISVYSGISPRRILQVVSKFSVVTLYIFILGFIYGATFYDKIPRLLGGGAPIPINMFFDSNERSKQLNFDINEAGQTGLICLLAYSSDSLLIFDPLTKYTVALNTGEQSGFLGYSNFKGEGSCDSSDLSLVSLVMAQKNNKIEIPANSDS